MLRLPVVAASLAALPLVAASAAPPAPIVFDRYLDRSEGAFRVLVPKGWIAEGGIIRVNPLTAGGPGQSIEAKLDFTVKREREGRVAVRWLPSTNYVHPGPGVITPSVNGMPVAPMPTPRDFATRALFPRLRPGARDVRVVTVEARPDVVAAMRASDKARGLVANGARYHVAAEAVTLAYREGSTAYRELVFAAIEGIELMGTAMWSNGLTIAARGPEAELAATSRIARVIVNSFALNPRWFAAEAQGQRYRAGVVRATQAELARLDREITAHRQQTQEKIQDQQYLTLTGQERWVNPHTGDVELGSNEWKHRWEDGFGQVIYTDEDRWDPNLDPALKVAGFKRSPAKAR
jgi:hypothetical protein